MNRVQARELLSPERTVDLIESFVRQQRHVTADMYRKRRLRELPLHLRRHVGRGAGQQYTWLAWEDGDRVYLATGEMAPTPATETDQPVLDIRNYHHDGRLLDRGRWVRARNTGRWERFTP